VCRFDGKSFDWLTDKILTAAPVRSIFEDKKGNYWFTYRNNVPMTHENAKRSDHHREILSMSTTDRNTEIEVEEHRRHFCAG